MVVLRYQQWVGYQSDAIPFCHAFHSLADIDECALEGQCIDGTCINSPGSFRCQCPPYYKLDDSGRICKGKTEYIETRRIMVLWQFGWYPQLVYLECARSYTVHTLFGNFAKHEFFLESYM